MIATRNNGGMDESQLRALLTRDGISAVTAASAIALDSTAAVARATKTLRAEGYTPEVVATALTQVRLRERARAKFGEFADQLLFTDDGLQQATRLAVAALHAGRFRDAGVHSVADLGCGIGADSLALASLDLAVTAVESDPITAAIAAYNLSPFSTARVVLGTAESFDLTGIDAVFCDPARRLGSAGAMSRTFDPAQFTPALDWVLSLASERPLGVKLGPGFPHAQIPQDCEALWISDGGTAVELGLWFGSLARPGRRFGALVLGRGLPAEIRGDEHARPVASTPLAQYIYDPDPAVIRAKALGTLATQLDAGVVGPGLAYLSTDRRVDTPFARRFEVTDDLAFNRKRLKALLRDRGIGTLEIKKRGVEVDPAELRKELSLRGTNSATLIITRVDGRHRAILAKRS